MLLRQENVTVQEHYNELVFKAEVFQRENIWELYRTKFIRDYDPLISVIIPNKDSH